MTTDALATLLDGNGLQSRLQVIVDLGERRIHAVEGLVRGPAGSPLESPAALFAAAAAGGQSRRLEEAALLTHLARFATLGLDSRLFLNVSASWLQPGAQSPDLARLVRDAGVEPRRVVLEITESERIDDFEALQAVAIRLRRDGFGIAIDDVGAGYSGLRLWSELQPEYAKIDRHFVDGIDRLPAKRQFVHSILEIGRALGSRVIAEGVETDAELDTLVSLGVQYVQGFRLGRPCEHPTLPDDLQRLARVRTPSRMRTTQSIASILRHTPAVPQHQLLTDVAQLFDTRADLRHVVITDAARPVGVLSRTDLLGVLASRYGRDLYGRRPIRQVMQASFLAVSVHMALSDVSSMVTSQLGEFPERDLVIVDPAGSYLGTASILDLLREITKLQIRSARYANPLTQLPGSVPLNEAIDQLLLDGHPFHLAYFDLDNFKPLNDRYGYAVGDDVIRSFARLLEDTCGPDDIVGHVGGDDFIAVLDGDDWQPRCAAILAGFERDAPRFYAPEDRGRGGIHGRDRQGNPTFFPFVSVSIGVVAATPYRFGSHSELASVASEVKHLAKKVAGNSLFVDRRRGERTGGDAQGWMCNPKCRSNAS